MRDGEGEEGGGEEEGKRIGHMCVSANDRGQKRGYQIPGGRVKNGYE